MSKAFLEKAKDEDGAKVPVECIDVVKKAEKPDHFAHFHEYLELLYLKKGSMHIWLNDRMYDFNEGELIVINSNETHRLAALTPTSEYFVIKFTPRLLCGSEQTLKETKYILPFLSEHSEQPRVYNRDFIGATKIPELLYDAMKEWKERSTGYELALKADVLKIIRIIVRYLDEQGINVKASAVGCNMQNVINSILEYVNENFKTVSEKETAERFNISYSYFSRTFKQIMNMSFKEYVNYMKINEAQKLLLTTNMSVTEISMDLGFSSSSHFINVFRKYKDCSPKQYKKTVVKEDGNEE